MAVAPTGPAEPTGGAVAVLRRVERASGALATQAVGRMHATLPWFGPMPAEHRAGVGLVVQVGITSFVEWCRRPEHAREVSVEVFRVAPRNLIRAVSLQQVVELVRIAVETVESAVPGLAGPAYEQQLRADVLRYSRDIAFAAAGVYARAAEERGAWDARLEALVVDHVLRGDVDVALPSRAAALGWGNPPAVTVVVGVPPDAEPETVIDEVHRVARTAGLEVLTGVHSERLVVVVGGAFDPRLRGDATPLEAARALLPAYGPGPVVVGPPAADLAGAAASARAALAAAAAVAGWPDAPRPVAAADLLPERALAGDGDARRQLVEEVYIPLRDAGTSLLRTVSAYLDSGSSLEGTARVLFLHPNTVRYRLRKAADACGLDPADPREGFTLHVALVVGRLTTA